MKKEELKHFLLPYQAIIKVTETNNIEDAKPLIVDPPKPAEELSWGIYEQACLGTTRVVTLLYQYKSSTGEPTGVVKNNTPGEPDYIPDQENSPYCPI